MRIFSVFSVVVALLASCSDPPTVAPPNTSGVVDAGSIADVGPSDGGPSDGGPSDVSETVPDAALESSTADAGLDLSCVTTQTYGGVGNILYFSVETCAGQPVPGLAPSQFVAKEDGQPLPVGAELKAVPNLQPHPVVQIVLDLSNPSLPYRNEMKAAALRLVDVLAAARNPRVLIGVSFYNGSGGYTMRGPALNPQDARDGINIITNQNQGGDLISADLFGAVRTVADNMVEGAAPYLGRNGGFGAFHEVVFTAGIDTAKRFTAASARDYIKGKAVQAHAIVVQSPVFDAAAQATLTEGFSGRVYVAPVASGLDAAAARVSARVREDLSGRYAFAYCSSVRSGQHVMSLELSAPSLTKVAAQLSFNGIYACSATSIVDCGGNTCGGVSCGTCDEDIASCTTNGGMDGNRHCVDPCDRDLLCRGEYAFNSGPFPYGHLCGETPTRTACQDTICSNTTKDIEHCGGCNTNCVSATATCGGTPARCTCPEGRCPETMADWFPTGTIVWSDASSTYVVGSYLDRQLRKINRVTGAVAIVSNDTTPKYRAVSDGTHVFFTNDSGQIFRMPLLGGMATMIRSEQANITIGLGAGYLYFQDTATMSIRRVPLSGGSEEVFASETEFVTAMASEGTSMFWSTYTAIRSKNGVSPTVTLASGEDLPYSIHANTNRVFWILANGTMFRSVARTGGPVATIRTGPVDSLAYEFVVNDTDAYVFETQKLLKLPLSGGAPTTLASGQDSQTGGVTAYGPHVYWQTTTRLPYRDGIGGLRRLPM